MQQTFHYYFFLIIINFLFADIITVSGTVIDNNSIPIFQVNIYTETKGTTTDKNGFFEITANKNDYIIFSHVGYKQIEFVANKIPNNIQLDKHIIPSNQILVKSGLSNHNLNEANNSISVISQSDLRVGNDKHFQDLIFQIPNLTYSSGTSRPRYILIRGIGEISQFAGEGPPNYSVSYIIDDIDYSGIGSIGSTFDMEQLDVYRGPQSYAFGPNAMAGVINIQSLNPSPFLSGKAEIGIDSNGGNNLGITFSNSLYQNIAFRITAYRYYTDGFINNTFRKLTNTNKQNEQYLRTKLIWRPQTWLNIKFTHLSGKMDNGYDAWTPDNNGLKTYTDYQGKDNLTTKSFSLKTNIKKLNSDISSTLSYSDNELHYAYDGDWGNPHYWSQDPYNWDAEAQGYDWSFIDNTIRNRNTIAHDLRIFKPINKMINLTAGLYNKELIESDNRNGWLFGGQATDIKTEFKINTKSIYCTVTNKLNNKTVLNIGTRFNQTDILYNGTGNTLDYTNWETIPIKSLDTLIRAEMIGLFFSTNFMIKENLHIFSSINRGYKAGGINQNPYLTETQRFYKPEYNLNITLGLNYQYDKIDALFTAFYMKRYNQQVRLSFQVNMEDPLSFDFFTANVTEGFNSGIEASIKYQLKKNLILSMNTGLLKNHVNSYSNPINNSQIYGNRTPAHSPLFSYSFILDYTIKDGIHINLESAGMDEFYFEDQYSPKSKYYNIYNANISYQYNSWNLSVWGKNILNEQYATKGYYFDLGIGNKGSTSYKMYGEPVHYGITLQYKI